MELGEGGEGKTENLKESEERKEKVARVLQMKTSSLQGANQIHGRALASSQ